MIKFDDLKLDAKMNCIEQFIGLIAWDYEGETSPTELWINNFDGIREDIDCYVEATPDQFWFDESGDWYDEGRKMVSDFEEDDEEEDVEGVEDEMDYDPYEWKDPLDKPATEISVWDVYSPSELL